jgi:hypothetical protein
MFDSNEHINQPLLKDDQPSWVKTVVEGSINLPWEDPPEEEASAPTRRQTNSGERQDNLPKIVLFMRLGNLGAAALLIFGSVRP